MESGVNKNEVKCPEGLFICGRNQCKTIIFYNIERWIALSAVFHQVSEWNFSFDRFSYSPMKDLLCHLNLMICWNHGRSILSCFECLEYVWFHGHLGDESVCILYICARVGFPIICIPNNIVMMHWQFPYVHVMNLRCIPVYETMRCIFYSTSQWRIFLKFLKGFGKNSVFNYCDLPHHQGNAFFEAWMKFIC